MSGYSDDCQWWWDGERWIATSNILIPDLPMTQFERSGRLRAARNRMRWTELLLFGSQWGSFAVPYIMVRTRAFREYRRWTLEQLALAASHLLGPDEPMLAGETTMCSAGWEGTTTRDLAVVVTGAHVLVVRIDFRDGQPRSVVLAAHPNEVHIELRGGPSLLVSSRNAQFEIRGDQRVFQPDPVLAAWRQAAGSASKPA